MDRIFQGLNQKQAEAVRTVNGPVLVISGPGSGKTRCLTHRIAYLISTGIQPENILGVTFTNKAAEEIRERVGKLLGNQRFKARPMLSTFHSLGLKILRREITRLGYGSNFSIVDTQDQIALVKRIMATLEIDSKRFNPNAVLNAISKLKTELVWADDYKGNDFFSRIVARIYRSYQSELKKINGLDFDDLIILTVKIFDENPEVLEKYQTLWKYILVDEYQDTSHDQYVLINLLAKKHLNLFCIGDDAQSIYMFREADIRNILNFQKDYPQGKVIMLEQNYRSTKNILAAAQGVISNNKAQITKDLWTDNDTGKKIFVRETLNERDEAMFVIDTMRQLMPRSLGVQDFTVLYRTHAQSRAMEEALITSGFPYRIIGGIKFYDRKEIKDILSYVRFLHNPADVMSFERVANVPARGLGKATLDKILAADQGNLLESILTYTQNNENIRQANALKEFGKILAELREDLPNQRPSIFIKNIIQTIGYEEYLKRLTGPAYENVEERIENLQELLTVAQKYDSQEDGIATFLEQIALLQETDKLKEGDNRVTLMTIHSSKGLEFPVVFLLGMEEGLFPHNRSLLEPRELEEERRLCYVAITRAKQELYMTHAKFRRIFGSAQANLPSRFLGEIPQNLLDYQLFSQYGEQDEKIDY
ncbi:MAG: exodeoxyribonuclease V subunit gamma [Candidatus Yanofskybacteria bacterium]|nr:exodeoxyribonuclease V subunit gamma [Candidatus Yanofskybacteria bacterium]